MDAQERWKILRLHVEDQIPLATLARDSGIARRTLERWRERYKTAGFEGLEVRNRSDHEMRTVSAELVGWIEGLSLARPRPSLATLHRLATVEAKRRDVQAPSYSTVRNIVQGLDPALVTLALEGPAAYRDRHELVLRRRADRPNSIWQADHTELDILILGAGGKTERPWLSVIMDDHSRAICGYTVFVGAPSALNTALALRQAIWRKNDPSWAMCGIPEILHVDHGSDFTSRHLERTAIDLHVRIIHSTVGRPQGRGKIERFFGTINTELLTTLPGHIVAGDRHPQPRLTLTTLDDALGAFIAEYNTRIHRELGVSPRDAWVAEGWMPRMPDSLEELDGLLLTVAKSRTVQRDGIHFQGLRYLSPTLAPFVGHAITIRYDPRDMSEIRVFDHDTLICRAVDEDHPNSRPSLRDIDAARRARRRALRKTINERIPIMTGREPHPMPQAPPQSRRRPKLRTYEEDD